MVRLTDSHADVPTPDGSGRSNTDRTTLLELLRTLDPFFDLKDAIQILSDRRFRELRLEKATQTSTPADIPLVEEGKAVEAIRRNVARKNDPESLVVQIRRVLSRLDVLHAAAEVVWGAAHQNAEAYQEHVRSPEYRAWRTAEEHEAGFIQRAKQLGELDDWIAAVVRYTDIELRKARERGVQMGYLKGPPYHRQLESWRLRLEQHGPKHGNAVFFLLCIRAALDVDRDAPADTLPAVSRAIHSYLQSHWHRQGGAFALAAKSIERTMRALFTDMEVPHPRIRVDWSEFADVIESLWLKHESGSKMDRSRPAFPASAAENRRKMDAKVDYR